MSFAYPFTRCLHPVKFFNQYTQKYMIVPCGRCKHCINRKNSNNQNLIDIHASSYKYVLFVTLTYNQENVPLADIIKVDTTTYLLDDDEILSETCTMSDKDVEKFQQKVHSHNLPEGKIPYLRFKDVRLFLIKLRQKIKQKRNRKYNNDNSFTYEINPYQTDEKITYYLCGEYGPKTFRPHYHLLFFFNDSITLQALRHFIPDVWTFGNTDTSISRGDAAAYLASYASSNHCVPRLLQGGVVRPKGLHSLRFGYTAQQLNSKTLLPYAVNFTNTFELRQNGKVRFELFTPSFVRSLYPKCRGFSTCPRGVALSRYRIFADATEYYSNNSCSDLTKLIMFDISQNNLPPFLTNCGWNPGNIGNGENQLKYESIYIDLLTSRKFLNMCRKYQMKDYELYDYIQAFYKRFSLLMMSYKYNMLENYLTTSNEFSIEQLYDDEFEFSTHFHASSLFHKFENETNDNYEHSVKHKTINDLNRILYNF